MNVINTNIAAKQATYAMARNERLMSTAMERLSTGLRINSAKDDAAGLAISSLMKAVVSGLAMASKNANDGISMLEVAEGATLEISNMLMRMRELAVQSSSGTYSGPDRAALDLEFTALLTEIHRIASETTWNTVTVLNDGNDATDSTATSSSFDIQLGANASQKDVANLSVSTTDPNYNPSYHWTTDGSPGATVEKNQSAYGDAVLYWNDNGSVKAINILTVESSQFAIDQLDKAILGVANERAKYGAYMSRLDHSSVNLLNVAQNTDESRSRIEDADYAAETSNLARAQIILQASTAMLAQANQSKQTVLGLLQ